jgi:sucrose-6F-phosphate phosphohydrolase
MSAPILLCSDLDRTLLPNGAQPESAAARPLLRALAARPEVRLAYVSGRDRGLLQQAMDEFELPPPDFAIGDVGTTIYLIEDSGWTSWQAWQEAIAPDWRGMGHEELAGLFRDLSALRLQEPERQKAFKLSYYADPDLDRNALLGEMGDRLDARGVRANLIWSVDEVTRTGLLDVLPAAANKLHAIRFLVEQRGFDPARTVFAGDSGNDLAVLTSELQGVLVANATEAVRREALEESRAAHAEDRLYLARGGFLGMNGNYSAGVLEGLAHYLPEVGEWLAAEAARLG